MINFNFGNHIQHQTAKRGMLVPGPTQRDNLQVVVKVERMPGGHGCQIGDGGVKVSSLCTALLTGSGYMAVANGADCQASKVDACMGCRPEHSLQSSSKAAGP